MTTPRWATAERKARLVQLWDRYGNQCLQGHRTCPDPSHYVLVDAQGRMQLLRLSDVKSEGAIRYWVGDDAAQRMAEWRAEQERLHRDQRRFRQGEFDSLRRQLYLENQPPYTIVALTVDSLTFRPVALVKVSSTIIRLFVNLEEPMGALSKSARRKARRYGKPLPEEAAQKAEQAIAAAVQDWWAKRK
ncbi:MAG: hypothetical protein Q8P22_02025 [Chloroflexota bacterium]|nr:hypothetical protein [Chloroflexota bacterium]